MNLTTDEWERVVMALEYYAEQQHEDEDLDIIAEAELCQRLVNRINFMLRGQASINSTLPKEVTE